MTLCLCKHQAILLLVNFLIQTVTSFMLCLVQSIVYLQYTDPTCVLLPPCRDGPITDSAFQKIAVCLATRFNLSVAQIRRHLEKARIKQYGKVKRLGGGDIMNASMLVPVGEDRRDASFIRVSVCSISAGPD